MQKSAIVPKETIIGRLYNISGVKLYCERTGTSGEPLVLIHGSWVDHNNWNSVVPLLSQSFQVITYDRRGHSQSECPASPGSTREDAADLAKLIGELGIAPAHIAGSSYGGSIALHLAAEQPDLFRSLVVQEPPLLNLLADESKEHKTMLRAAKEQIAAVVALLEAGDTEEGARRFIETIVFGPGAWEHIPSELKKTIIFNAPTFLDEMNDDEFFSVDLSGLESFPHPVLLTHGETGSPIFPPIMEKLIKAFPLAGLKIFHGAGHVPEQTHPGDYVATLTGFISDAGNRN